MRTAGHVARIGEIINAYMEKSEEKSPLRRPKDI
jgi:hypothetical protein